MYEAFREAPQSKKDRSRLKLGLWITLAAVLLALTATPLVWASRQSAAYRRYMDALNGSVLYAREHDGVWLERAIPDELMISILADILDNTPEAKKGVIFDGFPRTINQAKALKTMLAERGAQVDAVVGLEVEDAELVERLLKRGQESGRSDDNLETIQKRLEVYLHVLYV